MIGRLALCTALLAVPLLRAQDAAVADFLTDYARTQAALVRSNPATFARFVQPYAPLDLQVSNQPVADAQKARDRFLGAAAKAADITVDTVFDLDTRFHCDDCTARRQAELTRDLPRIRLLSDEFARLPATLHVVARWGSPGDFRVNNILHQGTHTQAFNEVDGFFPAHPGQSYAAVAPALAGTGITALALRKLLLDMAAVHIVALVRTSDGVRAISGGISHSEAGLLFATNPGFKPEPRDEDNGLRITVFTPIAKGVFYFES